MKKNALLFVLPAIALASCSTPAASSKEKVKLVEKTIETYSVVDVMNPDVSPLVPDPVKWAEHSKKGAMTYYVHPEYQNVLYTTFEGYGRLLSSSLPSNYEYTFSDNSINVKNNDAKTVFTITAVHLEITVFIWLLRSFDVLQCSIIIPYSTAAPGIIMRILLL